MKTRLPFTKMHGLGNDFVVVDDRRLEGRTITAELARKLCDRRFGVGADQVLWVRAARESDADARMEILNADGTMAEMCGNGIRAVALYLRRRDPKLAARDSVRVETLVGTLEIRATERGFRVNMGAPVLGADAAAAGEAISVRGRSLRFHEVSMGNPHAVFFGEDPELLPELGPLIERDSRFPKRTNVEFVTLESASTLRVRVWERGAGLTLACGTGACAVAVAAIASGRVATHDVLVRLPGGDLRISWEGAGQPVYMEGSAEEVFEGELALEA